MINGENETRGKNLPIQPKKLSDYSTLCVFMIFMLSSALGLTLGFVYQHLNDHCALVSLCSIFCSWCNFGFWKGTMLDCIVVIRATWLCTSLVPCGIPNVLPTRSLC